MKQKTLRRNGIKLSYQISSVNKPWLILIHGWGSNHSIWQPYVHYFKDRFSILTPDLRGHGKSQAGPVDMQTLREDLLAIMDKENIQTANVMGHSFGATIALDFASNHQDRTSSLVLATLTTRRYTFARPLVHSTVNLILAAWQPKERVFQNYWNENNTPVRFTVPLDLAGADKKVLHKTMRLGMSYKANWNSVKCPTLLLQGVYDLLAWNHRLRLDTKHKDNISLKVLPTHHLVTTTKAALVMQKLEVFWR
ncbi:MAG: alpha/beta fold hydrolase [Candidatus Nanoarchaeia archaeon]